MSCVPSYFCHALRAASQSILRQTFAVPTLSQKARKDGAPTLSLAASEVKGPNRVAWYKGRATRPNGRFTK